MNSNKTLLSITGLLLVAVAGGLAAGWGPAGLLSSHRQPAARSTAVATAGVAMATPSSPTAGHAVTTPHPSAPAAAGPSPTHSAAPAPASSAPAPPASTGPWFGTLATSGQYDGQEVAGGISVATLELGWDAYEPGNGAWNTTYINQQVQKANAFVAAGMRVSLSPGLQYPPSWVFALDANTYFVNQYGDHYAPTAIGMKEANAVYDPAVRNAQATYIARIAQDFGGTLSFIRLGGGWYGELHYPPQSFNGHNNSYWAFDANAQASSPARGWIPGHCCAAQAQQFWNYYAQSLVGYESWQIQTFRSHFSAQLEILFPGWGLRPGDVANAVNANLSGTTPAEVYGEMQQDSGYADEVNAVTDSRTIIYSDWLDAPDHGATLNTESPVKYLAYLAGGRGLRVAGENTGTQSLAALQLCVARVRALGLLGMNWAWEGNLFAGTSPTLSGYAGVIRS